MWRLRGATCSVAELRKTKHSHRIFEWQLELLEVANPQNNIAHGEFNSFMLQDPVEMDIVELCSNDGHRRRGGENLLHDVVVVKVFCPLPLWLESLQTQWLVTGVGLGH